MVNKYTIKQNGTKKLKILDLKDLKQGGILTPISRSFPEHLPWLNERL